MARKKNMVPHPFPKKGEADLVTTEYRKFLIEQAKAAGSKRRPAPIKAEPKKKKKQAEKQTISKKKSEVKKKPIAQQPVPLDLGPIKEHDGKEPNRPAKGYIEIKIKMDQKERHLAIGKLKEKGIFPVNSYYCMEKFVYWIPKEHKI